MKKVFVIEDNKVIQDILKDWFTDEKFLVITFENIQNLQLSVENFQPDLILTDIMLPGTDASEMIHVFGKIEQPVIVLSSMEKLDLSYFAKRIGAIASFSKPINLNEINDFIHKYFLPIHHKTNTLFI